MAKYDYLGTVKIARLLKVAPRTVAKWIDEGVLIGEKLPSGRRRVHRDSVVQFAAQRGMTMHAEDGSPEPKFSPETPRVADEPGVEYPASTNEERPCKIG